MYILPPSDLSTPTRLTPSTPSALLLARQATTTIITSAPAPTDCVGQYSGGALAGAVLGTFFGTLLLIYLFSVIRNDLFTGKRETEEVIVVEKKRRRRRSRGSGV